MYKLIIDYGKPYTENVKNLKELKKKLIELREFSKENENVYFEIEHKGKLLTETQIQEIIDSMGVV